MVLVGSSLTVSAPRITPGCTNRLVYTLHMAAGSFSLTTAPISVAGFSLDGFTGYMPSCSLAQPCTAFILAHSSRKRMPMATGALHFPCAKQSGTCQQHSDQKPAASHFECLSDTSVCRRRAALAGKDVYQVRAGIYLQGRGDVTRLGNYNFVAYNRGLLNRNLDSSSGSTRFKSRSLSFCIGCCTGRDSARKTLSVVAMEDSLASGMMMLDSRRQLCGLGGFHLWPFRHQKRHVNPAVGFHMSANSSGLRFKMLVTCDGAKIGRKVKGLVRRFAHRRGRFNGFSKVKTSVGLGLSSSDTVGSATADEAAQAGVFPAVLRRAEVQLPGVVLRVRSEEVIEGDSSEFLSFLNTAIANGATMIILETGKVGMDGGGRLYDAARSLKTLLRGRAQLLVAERADIAAAAGADGVLLSDQGLPAVVARRMMQNTFSEGSVLPLVARNVVTTSSALSATAAEGADLLILQSSEEVDLQDLVGGVCDQVSIPVFVEAFCISSSSSEAELDVSDHKLLMAGGNGIVLDAVAAWDSAGTDVPAYFTSLLQSLRLAIQQRGDMSSFEYCPPELADSNFVGRTVQSEESLDFRANVILGEERELLTAMLEFVHDTSAEVEEISLLVDALAQLDDPFLLVVVGEFNSGKSSVINALLGRRFLREGVLPTTNEITLLRHSGDAEAKERSERHPDGHFMQFLPAPLLKQMNLVDTPGTNVILQRQQRLTEEFVPRADLILFVLSADRPLTESEMTFLRYIRQWGKKVIFILNKSDIFKVPQELEEVLKFVADNAQRLLSIDHTPVYPVSARRALRAKLAVTNDSVIDLGKLSGEEDWKASGFEELENFILGFMGGATDAGVERMRLKLDTPLGIGAALLAGCERQLSAEKRKVEVDLQTLAGVEEQLERYEEALQSTAVLQRQRTTSLVKVTKSRAERYIDAILQLSKVETVAKYVVGGESFPLSSEFDSEVLGSAYTDVQVSLEEHATWLQSNNERQLNSYIEIMKSRWPDPNPGLDTSDAQDLVKLASKAPVEANMSLGVLKGFDTKAAMILLEQEIREVVVGTFRGIGAAGVSASVLTSILPTTWEDLLALGVCSAGGLVGVLNLPLKRADVKKKVGKVADSLARQLDAAMQTDLQESLSDVRADVNKIFSPYQEAARLEFDRVTALQARLGELENRLRLVRSRVQNL